MPLIANTSGTGSYYYASMSRGLSSVNKSSKTIEQSSSFYGDQYTVVLGPVDVSAYDYYLITLVNNSPNNLKSGSIEISPDGSNWIAVDGSTFASLTSSGVMTASFSGKCFNTLRVRAWSSGSGGAATGSIDAFITMN